MEIEDQVKVWDLFVRVFHWSLVATFIVAYLTDDDFLFVHLMAGYAVLGLLILRLVWGFIGTPYARFSNFSYSPTRIKEYLIDTLYFRAKRYLGHNPAGSAMIFILLVSLIISVLSGLAVYGTENGGPFAVILSGTGKYVEEALEAIHELSANFTLLLVFIHVGGVIVESILHRENLTASMVHGYKRAAVKKKSDI